MEGVVFIEEEEKNKINKKKSIKIIQLNAPHIYLNNNNNKLERKKESK